MIYCNCPTLRLAWRGIAARGGAPLLPSLSLANGERLTCSWSKVGGRIGGLWIVAWTVGGGCFAPCALAALAAEPVVLQRAYFLILNHAPEALAGGVRGTCIFWPCGLAVLLGTTF